MSRSTAPFRALAAAALATALALPLGAQAPAAAISNSTQKTLRAGAAREIRIDGRLDEAAWASATPAGDFVQQRPNEGEPATLRTEARVLLDGDALYVGMRMFDPAPDSILAQLTRRDEGSASDVARVFVDSYNDGRTAFGFGLNPRGVKDDFLRFGDGGGADFGWDAVWDGAARVDSAGWTAEFRIPLSQLRFQAARTNAEGKWGINFRRDIARRAENSFWSPIPPNSGGFVSRFGKLEGLSGVRDPRRMEIMPYTSATLARAPGEAENPFFRANDLAGSFGADVKAGLPAGLTFSATLNPDFGQVEVDPAVVNLSAFETFFPERRPFFVEGSDIFRFGSVGTFNSYGNTEFFYTRRVGRQPQGSLRPAHGVAFADVPDASTILGAAKVSGKAGPWSVGVMDAITAEERGRFQDTTGVRGEYPVEPMSNYFVGRVRRDLAGGRSVVGALVTATHRRLEGDEFDPYLRSRAVITGVDWEHTWDDRTWTLSGFLARSSVAGSREAILRTQNSSARYFGRPDADHLRLDEEREGLAGRIGALSLQRSGSWDLSLTYQETSPGFEANDLGFQGRADSRAFSTFAGRRVNKPSGPFRDHSFYGYTNHAWNFGGDPIFAGIGVGAGGTFRNLWNAGFSASFSPEYRDDRLTRGGALAATPSEWNFSWNAGTDGRKRLSAGASGAFRRTTAGGWERRFGVEATVRPSSSVRLSFGPGFYSGRVLDQFVDAFDDSTAVGTFGRRTVFANVDRTEVSLDTRLSWTFTPTLSLQLFAQPFVATGDYGDYKEFTTPGEFDFAVYGRDRGTIEKGDRGAGSAIAGCADRGENVYTVDPDGPGAAGCLQFDEGDFTVRSLRGNAVLRWEYRPGSTLFFVWQQERSGDGLPGSFRGADDFRGIFDAPARNVFLVKATYWLGR